MGSTIIKHTNNMANTKKEKTTKYATIVLKYSEFTEDMVPNAARLISTISDAILQYNKDSAQYGYSRFDITGFYIDPDDMDIEEQNEKLEEVQKQVNTTSLHNKTIRNARYADII